MRSIVSAAVVAACVACGGGAQTPPPASPPPSAASPLLSSALPEFTRPSLAGERVSTNGLRGKKTVVKFFAKYCEPCKKTLPAVQALHTRRPEIAFVGVSEDDGPTAASEVVRTYGLTFPVVLDSEHVLAGRFRVSELPVTFVADSSGVVRWVGGPGASDADLVAAIEAVQ